MATHKLLYASQDVSAETWSVYVEEYETATDEEPIDGSQRLVSTHEDEATAYAVIGDAQPHLNEEV